MASGHLQRELKKRDPFTMTEEEVALSLARTSDQVQIQFSRLFCEHELTPSQYNILRILRGEGKPLPILEIAERMVVVVPGITGLIDRLEAKGLVVRERSVEDRRIVYVSITDKGRALLTDLDGPIRALNLKLIGHLTRSEQEELIRLLEKIREPLCKERKRCT
jgi:DNA-binding MarR family transcriptional regulator